MTNVPLCPICDYDSGYIRSLKAKGISEQLEDYYNERPPDELGIVDYDMLSCNSCTLEFAQPMQSGTAAFYSWISSRRRYYPTSRWEWNVVLGELRRRDLGQINLLDVGCGEGEFISLAQEIHGVIAIGLDSTKVSVERCNARGLEVYCETIESFLLNRDRDAKYYDLIVMFHFLEHVSNPKGVIASLLPILKPAGKIIISTPYSPMSFEGVWFDPLNHPPHHLTRWNGQSLRRLAEELGMELTMQMPKAASSLERALSGIDLATNGPENKVSKRRLFFSALLRPGRLLGEYLRQRGRERIDGRIAADVVLAEFCLT